MLKLEENLLRNIINSILINDEKNLTINLDDTMQYNLEMPADSAAVELAYLYLLARPVESESQLASIVEGKPKIGNLRENILKSQEYRDNILRLLAIDYYVSKQSELLSKVNRTNSINSDNRITILQTCDDKRYPVLLEATKPFNQAYANKWKLDYSSYLGIKRGKHPHHAMLNRIYLLDEYINSGYTGWVLYLDSDSIISDLNYDIVNKLSSLRYNNQCLWLHNVYLEDDRRFEWFHINDGAFAIDLGSPIAQLVVRTWKGIYDNFYSEKDFENATNWLDIIDDQSSLSKILEIFELRNYVCLEQLQNFFAYQALRQDHQGISSDDELKLRAESIHKKGEEIYHIS